MDIFKVPVRFRVFSFPKKLPISPGKGKRKGGKDGGPGWSSGATGKRTKGSVICFGYDGWKCVHMIFVFFWVLLSYSNLIYDIDIHDIIYNIWFLLLYTYTPS